VSPKLSVPPRKGLILFLPIADLNPSNEKCIYSTLLFVSGQAKNLNVSIPSITFNQPMWLKAKGMMEAKLDVVCRLGGFHTKTSFLGSIGSLMSGSGLVSLCGETYAEHTITHIMFGKAVSRALRAHFLTEVALYSLLLRSCV